jgi:hypothetical protein
MVVASADQRCTVRVLHSPYEIGAVRCAVIDYDPMPGDRILLQVLGDGTAYVTGVLHRSTPPALKTPQGASVTVGSEPERLCIRDRSGNLICEFDAEGGRLVVHAREEIEITTPSRSLRLEASHLILSSERLQLSARELVAEFTDARWTAQRWQLVATRLHERVRDKIVDVENALQTRAGRVRTVVSATWEVLSRRTRLRSKEDTSVDGKRVLLG